MVEIKDLVKDLKYKGSFGNVRSPRLIMDNIDVVNNTIQFAMDSDYSNGATYSQQDACDLVAEAAKQNRKNDLQAGEDNIIAMLKLDEVRLENFLIDMAAFCLADSEEKYPSTISVEKTLEKHNCGYGMLEVYYTMPEEDYRLLVFKIRETCPDDKDYLRKKVFKAANKIAFAANGTPFAEYAASCVRTILGIKNGDFNELCECFSYEKIDNETVIIRVLGTLDEDYLLRFRGFNYGYTKFKLYKHINSKLEDADGELTMIKRGAGGVLEYRNIEWSSNAHIQTCSRSEIIMKKSLERCVQLKLLMF